MRTLLTTLTLLALLGQPASAAESSAVTLDSGAEILVERFGQGDDRLLWIPTEYGVREAHPPLAKTIAAGGMEVWLADLHSSYFITPGRSSYTTLPVEDAAELIQHSLPAKGRLYVLSTGRGAAFTLMALRRWRQVHPQEPALGGVILLHPNLQAGSPKPGRTPDYLPIAGHTNLPIYIVQPVNSSKRWFLNDLVGRLSSGGSTVFSQLLPDAGDGFHTRPENEEERQAAAALPGIVQRAIRLLARFNQQPRSPVQAADGVDDYQWRVPAINATLQPYPGQPQAPALELIGLDGRRHTLADYRGKVVLVNFWASWCPPCVEEIPSLNRLQTKLAGKDFTILGIDMGEDAETVRRFLEQVPAEYPVLLDPDDSAVKPWKLRAFPTTFLIDREGRIRYGYFGGLAWDAEEVVERVESLL